MDVQSAKPGAVLLVYGVLTQTLAILVEPGRVAVIHEAVAVVLDRHVVVEFPEVFTLAVVLVGQPIQGALFRVKLHVGSREVLVVIDYSQRLATRNLVNRLQISIVVKDISCYTSYDLKCRSI